LGWTGPPEDRASPIAWPVRPGRSGVINRTSRFTGARRSCRLVQTPAGFAPKDDRGGMRVWLPLQYLPPTVQSAESYAACASHRAAGFGATADVARRAVLRHPPCFSTRDVCSIQRSVLHRQSVLHGKSVAGAPEPMSFLVPARAERGDVGRLALRSSLSCCPFCSAVALAAQPSPRRPDSLVVRSRCLRRKVAHDVRRSATSYVARAFRPRGSCRIDTNGFVGW
jgi:hypothetical protein